MRASPPGRGRDQAGRAGYAHVYYLTAPAARGVVASCAAALPGDAPTRITVWDLPPAARTPGT